MGGSNKKEILCSPIKDINCVHQYAKEKFEKENILGLVLVVCFVLGLGPWCFNIVASSLIQKIKISNNNKKYCNVLNWEILKKMWEDYKTISKKKWSIYNNFTVTFI